VIGGSGENKITIFLVDQAIGALVSRLDSELKKSLRGFNCIAFCLSQADQME
jgi:hypothetical protein